VVFGDVKGLGGVRGGAGNDRFTPLITTIDVDAGAGDDTLRAVPGGPQSPIDTST
jgi:hypothetical protein